MKKILFISNIGNGKVGNFSKSSMLTAKHLNYEFHMAINCSGADEKTIQEEQEKYNIMIHNINFQRKPISFKNIRAYKELLNLMKKEKFDLVHCNTPIGGILGRICAKKLKIPKIIYTAHGFHFYKGAPLINKVIYKTIEKWLARYTDVLITINNEDYEQAQKFKLRKNGKVELVHGVGIDVLSEKINEEEANDLKEKLGIKQNDIVCITAGELNKNKNHKTIIKAINKLKINTVHLLVCGVGKRERKLIKLVKKYDLEKQVHFLGYRSDISKLLDISNIYIQMSYREGLSRSIMEAMTKRLPCIVSKIRGNVDLIEDKKGGYLCEVNNVKQLSNYILELAKDKKTVEKMGKFNRRKIKKYDINNVKIELEKIYKMVDGE